eukprot:COSAG06_NODE_16726_length_984_cov_1.819209_1_plen_36_part_10
MQSPRLDFLARPHVASMVARLGQQLSVSGVMIETAS